MKTIHITSQDDLPDVAEAVIEALGRRTACTGVVLWLNAPI